MSVLDSNNGWSGPPILWSSGSTDFISQPEMSCVCVCVCVWVCTFRCMFKSFDVRSGAVIYPNFRFQLFHKGTQHVIGTVSNKATNDMGYQSWPLWRTCFPNHLSFHQRRIFLPSLSSTMTSMTGS